MNEPQSGPGDPSDQNRSERPPRNDKKRSKRKAKSKGKNRQKNQPALDPVKFWGDPGSLPEPMDHVGSTPDLTAVVSSLGRVPIPPHETAAEHSFRLVYLRAGALASALATASGLDDDGESG